MTNSRELKLTKVVSPRPNGKNSDRNNTPIRHERPKIATSGKTSYRQILNHTHYHEVIHREGNAVVIQDSNGDNKMRGIAHMKKNVEPKVVGIKETVETTVLPETYSEESHDETTARPGTSWTAS